MRLLHEFVIFQTVKSKVIISLFETVRLSVSISPRNLYNSLNSIKEKTTSYFDLRDTVVFLLTYICMFCICIMYNRTGGITALML